MNAMDRIHHVEHRRRPRGAVAFERTWSGTTTRDAARAEPSDAAPVAWSADDFAD